MSTSCAADQAAAHQFLVELRTRITIHPLPYQHGVEERALTSVLELFAQAREAINKNPGCEKFAGRAIEVLNLVLRPFAAKWHAALLSGLLNSRECSGKDWGGEFRAELPKVQEALRTFAAELQE